MKTLLTDIDGVVLDWEGAFHEWMEHNGYGAVVNTNTYHMGESYEMGTREIKRLIETFNSSASIGFLSPLRDAAYWVNRIAMELQYSFIAVSSLSVDEHAQKLRTSNLKDIFGPKVFYQYHYLACGADKDAILERLSKKHKGCVWVEDKIENYEVGEALGFDCYLMEHEYNKNSENKKFVKNWENMYNILKERMNDQR